MNCQMQRSQNVSLHERADGLGARGLHDLVALGVPQGPTCVAVFFEYTPPVDSNLRLIIHPRLPVKTSGQQRISRTLMHMSGVAHLCGKTVITPPPTSTRTPSLSRYGTQSLRSNEECSLIFKTTHYAANIYQREEAA